MGRSLGGVGDRLDQLSRDGSVRLTDRLGDRRNNFDLLRLAAAAAVVVSHSFAVVDAPEPLHQFHTTLGSTAVIVFFAVSGLLVRRSWERDPRPSAYWAKRVSRVWPGLVAVTVVTALLVGPLVTTVPLRTYFASPETWTYPLPYVLMTPFGAELPGVFVDNPVARAVNGPLWTLHVEVFAYGMLFLLGVSRLLRHRLVLTVITAGAVTWAAWIATPAQPDLGAVNAVAAFAVGACAYSWREHVLLSHRGAVLALALVCVTAPGPDALRVAAWTLGAAYLSFWFAYAVPVIGRWLTAWGDASYGVYVFAFPVQQTIVSVLGPETPPWAVIALTLPTVWVLAIASWHLLERPALAVAHRAARSSAPRGQERAQERAEPCFQAAGDRFQSP